VREQGDVESSTAGYAARFAGPVGAWMLGVQERITLRMLEAHPGATVLDVGGGHGQLCAPLARAGWPVTVLGSAPSCGARIAGLVAHGRCRFVVGDLLALPFPDRAFDVVTSFRLLPHCDRWELLVGELCRVARTLVIVDYPTIESVNKVAPALFGAKKKLEGNTRTFTLFTHREVAGAFAGRGFALERRVGQFFLPMVLHRALRCRPCSAALEAVCRGVGLTGRWGSPVIAAFRRGSGAG
jgi:2-polyprenyl-3-methyl-5-hydroxy-6-metoxy-1,4-benzoquinol methylase